MPKAPRLHVSGNKPNRKPSLLEIAKATPPAKSGQKEWRSLLTPEQWADVSAFIKWVKSEEGQRHGLTKKQCMEIIGAKIKKISSHTYDKICDEIK